MSKQKGKKKGKKGRKKNVDAYARKLWYGVFAPNPFKEKHMCYTPANKTVGLKFSEDYLHDRVFEVNAADLQSSDESLSHLVFKLKVSHVEAQDEPVEKRECYATFFGVRLTKNKMGAIIRKNRGLIRCQCDVRTSDGYRLRVQIVATTARRKHQVKKTTYLHVSQRKRIREKMRAVVARTISKCDISKLIDILLHRYIERELENQCSCFFPICQTQISKITVLHAPKLPVEQVMKLHTDDN